MRLAESPISDRTYIFTFLSILGLSFCALCLARYISDIPIFPSPVTFKPIRFRIAENEPLLANGHSVAENGDVGEPKGSHLEPLTGWRYRLGILMSLVLLALVIVHTVIFITEGMKLLDLTFIFYWVFMLHVVIDDDSSWR